MGQDGERRKKYSEAVIDGIKRKSRIFVGDSIVRKTYSRLSKGEDVAHNIDWNEKIKNKTATECWNILKGEIYSAIDSFVPMKKQVKRSKKKHLSKEAFRNIRHKQYVCGGFISIRERMNMLWFTKRH